MSESMQYFVIGTVMMFNVQTETSKNQELKYKLLVLILPEVIFIITFQEINMHVDVHAWKSEQKLMCTLWE